MERAIIHFWTIPPHSTPLQSTPFLGCTVRSGRAQPFYSLVGFFYATFSKNQTKHGYRGQKSQQKTKRHIEKRGRRWPLRLYDWRREGKNKPAVKKAIEQNNDGVSYYAVHPVNVVVPLAKSSNDEGTQKRVDMGQWQCVCVRERERESERNKERKMDVKG